MKIGLKKSLSKKEKKQTKSKTQVFGKFVTHLNNGGFVVKDVYEHVSMKKQIKSKLGIDAALSTLKYVAMYVMSYTVQ